MKKNFDSGTRGIAFILAFCGLLLTSGNASGSGGTCPSGANYLNPSNPTGALVTLASLGITNCYYISAAGTDTNNGTSESTPWLHAPMMASCSNNCAAVHVGQGTQLAGTGFIFRGGDTWHFGHNTGDYTGGVWEWNPSSGGPSGTSANPIYLGVDPSWYSGGSWVRPLFTADNSLCGSGTTGTMPDGDTCTGTTDSFGQPSYYVSACAYQIAANGGNSNDFFEMNNNVYIMIDNFEMTGLCQSGAGGLNGRDTYISYGSANTGVPIYGLNNYIHGASHVQYAGKNGSAACNPTGVAICINLTAFYGANYSSPGAVGESLFFNIVDFSDSDPGGENLTLTGFYNVAYNVFRYTTQGLMSTLHLFHDNLYEYYFENGHSNMIESNDPAGTNAFYNNVFRHVETYAGGGVGLWFGPASGATDYIFNNLMYDVGNVEYFNIGGVALTTVSGNYVIFNNTFQANVGQSILRCENYTNGSVADVNNYFIDDSSYNGCSNMTNTTPLAMTNAVATTNRYNGSQAYSYSPTSSGSPTVGAGTNENTAYCGALTTAGLTAAATACASDETYACTYNTTNHAVVCPARTAVTRPPTGAWDVGAYQFGTSAQPQPPTNVQATGH